jgi:hypothetical protein
MRSPFRLWLASATLVAAACFDNATIAPTAAIPPTPLGNITSETSTDLWRSIIVGETRPGSVYAIYVPRGWNGDVVFYAHGIRDVLDPVGLQDQDNYRVVRDALGAVGFAVAYSSFSENGYDIADAARRTHQLRGLFVSRFGQPAHSYLFGHSLGALAILRLADQYANQYDGVAPVCGIVGGTPAQLDYVVNIRALFDYFYPGILPGSASEPIPGYVIDGAKQNQIIAAVSANPLGLAVIASTEQTKLEFTNSTELVTSLVNALHYHARGADNVLTFTHGKFPVSNVGLTYTPRQGLILPPLTLPALTGILAQLNAQIARFDADRAGAFSCSVATWRGATATVSSQRQPRFRLSPIWPHG